MKPDVPQGRIAVSLFIPTFRRPRSLRRTLESIAAQEISTPGVTLRVYLIDNDAEGCARPVFDALAPGFPFPLTYLPVPERGISQARNRALDRAAADEACDFLAFIDDDEVADPLWLHALLEAQRAYRADVVTGPVVRAFPDSAPPWVAHASIFRRKAYRDGEAVPRAASGNVLIRTDVIRRSGLRFDHRLALTGGEDELYFIQLNRLGYSIHWHNAARLTERVPEERLTRRWVFRRALCHGNALARMHLILRPRFQAVVYLLAFAGYQNVRALQQVWRFIRGQRRYVGVDLLQYLSTQLGVLSGLLGWKLENYRHVQGG
ncbi:glycosyltransferase family 2 protein [Thioalkalivibrio thiocyanodenitrificans]|uniref:glycosyltransferase family 2 protein n=1 Tax=Thioalkalivibrio thiocyanodenitrificans TaxID=243063 RepID=UPI00036A6E0B|nr:glycosyltransferase family 2 protein [Thioalkalivibrio thiocyanodenitrificans]